MSPCIFKSSNSSSNPKILINYFLFRLPIQSSFINTLVRLFSWHLNALICQNTPWAETLQWDFGTIVSIISLPIDLGLRSQSMCELLMCFIYVGSRISYLTYWGNLIDTKYIKHQRGNINLILNNFERYLPHNFRIKT